MRPMATSTKPPDNPSSRTPAEAQPELLEEVAGEADGRVERRHEETLDDEDAEDAPDGERNAQVREETSAADGERLDDPARGEAARSTP